MDGWQSGRMRSLGKRVCPKGTEGSNPSPSAQTFLLSMHSSSLKTAALCLFGFFLYCVELTLGQNVPNLSYDDFTTKLSEAQTRHSPVLLFLASETSATSKKLDSDVFPIPGSNLKKSLHNYMFTRINGGSPEGKQVEEAYGWHRFPVLAILNSNGELFSMLDLSMMSEQLINASTQDQLAAWLDRNLIRFKLHGVLGYAQTPLSNLDHIQPVLAEWEKVKNQYTKESKVLLLDESWTYFDGLETKRYRTHFIEFIGKSTSIPYLSIPVSLWQKSAKFKMIRARVISPTLKVNEVDPTDIVESTGYLNEPQYNHVRSENILFPGIKEGSIVEGEWEIEFPTQMPHQASTRWMISNGHITSLHSHAEFTAPTSSEPKAQLVRNHGGLTKQIKDGKTTLIYEGHSEHIQSELDENDRDLPVTEEVIFNTKNSWEEIGKWFISLTNFQGTRSHSFELNQWVAAAVQGVAKGADYERRVANAILHEMQNNFRYLGIELADSGCQPHPVNEILKNKCGDCKDLSLFLQEALKTAGVESHLVLVNTHAVDPFETEMPRVNYFNHVILQIGAEGNPVFADPTLSMGACVLPPGLYEKGALLCSEKTATPITLPYLDEKTADSSFNLAVQSLTKTSTPTRIELNYTGFMKFYLMSKMSGLWKSAFDKHESVFLKNYFKEFEITNHFIEHDDSSIDPLQIKIDAKISDLIQQSDESLLLTPFFTSTFDLQRFPHRIKGRKKDEPTLITTNKMPPLTERITYPLPVGFIFERPPEIHIDTPYFSVNRTYEISHQKLTIITTLMTKAVPGPARYVKESELPKDAQNLYELLSQPLRLKMSPGQMLREACASNNRERVAELLKQEAPMEELDDANRTPLMIASKAGNVEIVKDLIAAKANVQAGATGSDSPLAEAIRSDHIEIANVLINAGADINAPTNGDDLARPINYAAARGNVELLTKLLDAGADLNSNSGEGTPFYLAVQYNHFEAVKYLLSKKPDLTLLPFRCSQIKLVHFIKLPLAHAATEGSLEMLKLLLENGADPNAVNPECDESALFFAAGWNKSESVNLLLEHGAKVDQANYEGITPLINAVKSNHLDLLKPLITHGANINAQAKDGCTALIYATRKGYFEMVKALVEAGANVNSTDKAGGTAVNYAALRGSLPILNYLKENGARDTYVHFVASSFPLPSITPAQAWGLSLAAIYFQEFGHPQLVLGRVEEWDSSLEQEKKTLNSVWNIFDRASLLAQLDNLKKEGHRTHFIENARSLAIMDDAKFNSYLNGPLVRDNKKLSIKNLHDGYKKWQERFGLAFDLCRYANLVAWGHRCGYITQHEAWDLFEPVSRIAKKNFSSWSELGQNFLDGRAAWVESDDENKGALLKSFVEILSNPNDRNSPWNKVPWNTDLSGPFTTSRDQ